MGHDKPEEITTPEAFVELHGSADLDCWARDIEALTRYIFHHMSLPKNAGPINSIEKYKKAADNMWKKSKKFAKDVIEIWKKSEKHKEF